MFFLEPNDFLKADDLVRNAIPSSRRTQYTDLSNDDTDWKKVKDAMPFWVGKKIKTFLKGVEKFRYQPNRYEFVRKA